MAQIMEFLLNLLLMRGKHLTATAAETLNLAIKKILYIKQKISPEFTSSPQIVKSFEDMFDLINYSSKHYTCDSETLVVTNEIPYDLYEKFLLKMREINFQNNEMAKRLVLAKNEIEEVLSNSEIENKEIPKVVRHEVNKTEENVSLEEKRKICEDYIVDNLSAIIKSQELLFKNIIKLVNILEKDEVLTQKTEKLVKIKKKLNACTDILVNNPQSKISSIIDSMMEEEVTRCRLKTFDDLRLKSRTPRGLEVALDISREKGIFKEKNKKLEEKNLIQQKRHHAINVCNSESEMPKVAKDFINSESKEFMNIDDARKLLEINEEHFKNFENNLWHSLTTMKYLALKDDYSDCCKCAFYNKRHFIKVDNEIANKLKDEDDEIQQFRKFISISESVFQIMERRILLEKVHQELYQVIQHPMITGNKNSEIEETKKKKDETNPFLALQTNEKPLEVNLDEKRRFENKTESVSKETQTTEEIKKKIEERKENKISEELVLKPMSLDIVESNIEEQIDKEHSLPKIEVKDQSMNTEINGGNLQDFVRNLDKTDTIELKTPTSARSDQETNTILSSFKITEKFLNENRQSPPNELKNRRKDIEINIKPTIILPSRQKDRNENREMTNLAKSNKIDEVKKNVDYSKVMNLRNISDKKTSNDDQTKQNSEKRQKSDNFETEKTNAEKEKKSMKSQKDKSSEDKEIPKQKKVSFSEENAKVMSSKKEKSGKNKNVKNSFSVPVIKNSEDENASNNKNSYTLLKNDVPPSEPNKIDKYAKNAIVVEKKITSEFAKRVKNDMPGSLKQKQKIQPRCKSVKFANEERQEMSKLVNRHSSVFSKTSNNKSIEDTKQKNINKEENSLKNLDKQIDDKKNDNAIEISKLKSTSELNNEAERLKVNEKAFKELEETIRTVKIFVEKTPSRTNTKSLLKSSTQSKRRKINDPDKKNMSTNNIDFSKRNKKAITKCSMTPEKTFLKSNSETTLQKSKSSTLTPKSTAEFENKEKNLQMRRTTKNAMKRQQVQTILPKVTKEMVKKKPLIALVETKEIKALRNVKKMHSQERRCSTSSKYTFNYCKSISRHTLPVPSMKNKTVYCASWETEDEDVIGKALTK